MLAIKDDGSGLTVRRRKNTGLGLRIMRYRADMIGGSLAIQKAVGGGTAVVCAVPPADGLRVKLPGGKLKIGRTSSLKKERKK